jgi:hypothetical protein
MDLEKSGGGLGYEEVVCYKDFDDLVGEALKRFNRVAV